MQSYQSRETLRQKGEIMDKDQIKGIIMDLRSKGLSFQKISDILRELHSVDLNRETVRMYFKESIRKASVKAHDDSVITTKEEPVKLANASAIQEQTKAQTIEANVRVQNNVNVQSVPVRKVRYPGFEDEDLKKDPNFSSIPISYKEASPEQRYKWHKESVERTRKERNKSITITILFILLLLGIVFLFKYGLL
jgi:hypothetical protein